VKNEVKFCLHSNYFARQFCLISLGDQLLPHNLASTHAEACMKPVGMMLRNLHKWCMHAVLMVLENWTKELIWF